MTFEGSEPAGIVLNVCMQQRKPKLVEPCSCCTLGVTLEQVTKTATGFSFRVVSLQKTAQEQPKVSVLRVKIDKRTCEQGCSTVQALNLLLLTFIA